MTHSSKISLILRNVSLNAFRVRLPLIMSELLSAQNILDIIVCQIRAETCYVIISSGKEL